MRNAIYPYAGFWKRVGASILDSLIIGIPMGILLVLIIVGMVSSGAVATGQEMSLEMQLKFQGIIWAFRLCSCLVFLLYGAGMESSSYQATFGKKILGIKVVDKNGEQLSFWHAFGRNIGKWVSALTLNIGYFMAGATRKKQALHDIMASAYVVDDQYIPGEELPEVQPHWGLLALAVVLEILPIILLIGFLSFAIAMGAAAQ